ncbi:hypothetical protein Tco_0461201 [Tanacetum coccineum]
MVDIPNNIDLVDYDEEDPEEEPEEYVEIELEDDAELIYPYEVGRGGRCCTRGYYWDYYPKPYAIRDFPKGLFEVVESSSARDSSHVDGLAPWALRHDLEASCAQARVMEAELVLESRENATLKKRLAETETKLAVPKPPSDDEDTEHLRKKSKNSTSDGTEGPSEPRGPPRPGGAGAGELEAGGLEAGGAGAVVKEPMVAWSRVNPLPLKHRSAVGLCQWLLRIKPVGVLKSMIPRKVDK